MALLDRETSEIQFMKILKRRGLRIEPWRTPEVIGATVEVTPSRTTL